MIRWPALLWGGVKNTFGWCGWFVLWSVWLALALMFALLVFLVTADELAVPDFLLRRIEQRLASEDLRATAGRTVVDLSGTVLVENLQVFLPAFQEPVATARSAQVWFDPWLLTIGRFEVREVRISGARILMPAQISPSGQTQELVQSVDTAFRIDRSQVELEQFTARFSTLPITARGSLNLAGLKSAPGLVKPGEHGASLSQTFSAFARQAFALAGQLGQFEQPSLAVELASSNRHAALAKIIFLATSAEFAAPIAVRAGPLQITTRLPLRNPTNWLTRVEVATEKLDLPFDARTESVRAFLTTRMDDNMKPIMPQSLDLVMASATAKGFSARALSATIKPRDGSRLHATVAAHFEGATLAVQADVDWGQKRADVHFEGGLSPRLLIPVSEQLKVHVPKFFDFETLAVEQATVQLGAGWNFEQLNARVRVHGIKAYHVNIDEGRAVVKLDRQRFIAPEAYGRIGDNFARGSYEHTWGTHDFRFLLAGQLRPLDISGWFGEWWPNFFKQLEFPTAPPTASVDVTGRWREPWSSHIFVFADADHPVVRTAAFDRVRTRLFIRPAFFDGLELLATQAKRQATGTFTYVLNPEDSAWRTFDFQVATDLDLKVATTLIGPQAGEFLSIFKMDSPPALRLSGRLEGPASPNGPHQQVEIQATTQGSFRFHDFPLENVSFTAQVQDTTITLAKMAARFAGGFVEGKAKVSGEGPQRRIGFDYTLQEASLGVAVAIIQDYAARRKGVTPPPPGKFVQEKVGVNLNLAIAAEGLYNDPLTYQGTGTAELEGPGLGEVPLLGSLSDLLKFTALRFTTAKGKFKIAGPRLTFSELSLRGSNSAIDGHGDYALDKRELDFYAKIFPFQESGSFLKSVVGAVLSPLSNVFEVKLAGSLEKPQWSFVIGPSNLLRPRTPGETAPTPPPGNVGPETVSPAVTAPASPVAPTSRSPTTETRHPSSG